MINYHHLDSCTSTNDVALHYIIKHRPTNSFVYTTSHQTQGKGTHKKKWYSERNSSFLYTLGFYKKNAIFNNSLFSFTAAKTVQDVIKTSYNIELTIKKPNDLLLNGKKCAGILIQNRIQGSQSWTIIGIGININTLAFPSDLKNLATSFYLETKQKYQFKNLDKSITNLLLENYNKIMLK